MIICKRCNKEFEEFLTKKGKSSTKCHKCLEDKNRQNREYEMFLLLEFIKKKYQAKEVILELKEDDKLLGGIKIEIGDEIIDMTLKNKIKKLQNYLLSS